MLKFGNHVAADAGRRAVVVSPHSIAVIWLSPAQAFDEFCVEFCTDAVFKSGK